MLTGTEPSTLLDRLATPPPRRHWPRPLRALRALRQLLQDPDDTQKAVDVTLALDGDWSSHQIAEMVRSPQGRQLFTARPDLLAILADREALAALPAGSFGRAYHDHMTKWNLDAGKIVDLYRKTDPANAHRDEAQIWLVERENLMHDLFHALSGYGADGLGEGALLWFGAGQQVRPSRIFLATGASIRISSLFGLKWIPYAFTAWRRGRKAANLLPVPYEDLLPLPLSQVRQALQIENPSDAHKGGVLEAPEDFAFA
jgi:ubiquinone biosynthesis protein COQ4